MACQNHAKETGATPQKKNYITQSTEDQSNKNSIKTKQPFTFCRSRCQ